ncbi:MAG TPA: NBR1-Ig-like domain-containing protein, partial [Anaerolineaceae bacterium]
SPKSTNKITPGMDFDGQWVVTNTGSETWLHTDVDIKYVSGTKFQTKGDLFDLKSDVAKAGSYTVIVDMLAPATIGTYYATWTLAHGSLSFCTLNLTLVVVAN